MRFLFDIFTVSLAAVTVVRAGELLAATDSSRAIAGKYIVMMEDGLSSLDFSTHRSWASSVRQANSAVAQAGIVIDDMDEEVFDFTTGLKAYGGSFDELTASQIANQSEVKYVEPDVEVRATDVESQGGAPWGLIRISHEENKGDKYIYDSKGGEGITVYGIDSGINIEHQEFDDERASWGTNTVDDDDKDVNGHGTHTASTVVGKSVGVARKAKIVAVKVLGGEEAKGSGGSSIKGVQWVVDQVKKNDLAGKAVINMSLGSSFNRASNDAVAEAVKAGIFVAVSAGNDETNADDHSPASEEKACTVAASNDEDKHADFSNFGKSVDLYAPGVAIAGANAFSASPKLPIMPGGPITQPYVKKDGTSMAAPHVAGVGAYLMSLEDLKAEEVCDKLKDHATDSMGDVPKDTTKKLLFNGIKIGGAINDDGVAVIV